jgi:cell wall-associated NlpC family hydrolase
MHQALFTEEQLQRYRAIPFEFQGRGFAGGDCLNIPLLVFKEKFGIFLQDYTSYPENLDTLKTSLFEEQRHLWPIKEELTLEQWGAGLSHQARVGDILLFNLNKCVCHCGVVVQPGYFLHTSEGGTSVTSISHPRWLKTLRSIWRLDI